MLDFLFSSHPGNILNTDFLEPLGSSDPNMIMDEFDIFPQVQFSPLRFVTDYSIDDWTLLQFCGKSGSLYLHLMWLI